jgi:hypothetical protein
MFFFSEKPSMMSRNSLGNSSCISSFPKNPSKTHNIQNRCLNSEHMYQQSTTMSDFFILFNNYEWICSSYYPFISQMPTVYCSKKLWRNMVISFKPFINTHVSTKLKYFPISSRRSHSTVDDLVEYI